MLNNTETSDMHIPQISVIVPVYNVEPYIRKCIDSLLNQTFRDFELLLVDDGSTDRSGAICDEYVQMDARVRVFHTPNQGVSAARNWGLDQALGGWITFVDSDDWVESECYASAVKEFDRDSEIDIVCWGANIFNLDLDENSSYIKGARNYHKIKNFWKYTNHKVYAK